MSLRDPGNEPKLQTALLKLAAREQLTDDERALIQDACVDDYNHPIIAARQEANRKYANGEPLTIREQAWVDHVKWQDRCIDAAFWKAITKRN